MSSPKSTSGSLTSIREAGQLLLGANPYLVQANPVAAKQCSTPVCRSLGHHLSAQLCQHSAWVQHLYSFQNFEVSIRRSTKLRTKKLSRKRILAIQCLLETAARTTKLGFLTRNTDSGFLNPSTVKSDNNFNLTQTVHSVTLASVIYKHVQQSQRWNSVLNRFNAALEIVPDTERFFASACKSFLPRDIKIPIATLVGVFGLPTNAMRTFCFRINSLVAQIVRITSSDKFRFAA